MDTYTTMTGDQWDMIAREVYGSELRSDWLMENNRKYIGVFQFDAGVVLSTPAMPEDDSGTLPPWRSAT